MIPDGGTIAVLASGGTKFVAKCKYIDASHVCVNGDGYHIDGFAERAAGRCCPKLGVRIVRQGLGRITMVPSGGEKISLFLEIVVSFSIKIEDITITGRKQCEYIWLRPR